MLWPVWQVLRGRSKAGTDRVSGLRGACAATVLGAEVIRVVARRRRWTLEQKLALVVLDRQGVSRSLVFEWRRQAREGTMPGLVRKQAPPSRGTFARPGKPAATIEVVLTHGRTLRFSRAIDDPDRIRCVGTREWTH